MSSRIQTEAQALRVQATSFSVTLCDVRNDVGLSAMEIVEMCGHAENLAHVLGNILEVLAELLSMESDSPSVCRARERLWAACPDEASCGAVDRAQR